VGGWVRARDDVQRNFIVQLNTKTGTMPNAPADHHCDECTKLGIQATLCFGWNPSCVRHRVTFKASNCAAIIARERKFVTGNEIPRIPGMPHRARLGS
jgi:hypothetical protein